MQYLDSGSLAILVSTPGSKEPGLYHWSTQQAEPRKLCAIAAPSFFSFDRKWVIERIRGVQSRIKLYSPETCRLIADLEVEGRAMDVDVRGQQLAVASRDTRRQYSLQLYNLRGAKRGSAATGSNIEMGFAPDGRVIVNFDLSDVGARAWRVPQLAPMALPEWMQRSEVSFIPGSLYLKHYADERLVIARWPTGVPLYALAASRATRVRQLSADGRFGALHEHDRDGDRLDWVDFKSGERRPLAQGSIDNAAVNAAGDRVAWTLRSGNQITVQRVRAALPLPGE